MLGDILNACWEVLEINGDPQSAYWLASQMVEMRMWRASEHDVRAEIPAFVGKIKEIFEGWQRVQYPETAKKTEPFDPSLFEPQQSYLLGEEKIEVDAEEIEDMRKDDIRQCTRDLLLVERAREWLLEEKEGRDSA